MKPLVIYVHGKGGSADEFRRNAFLGIPVLCARKSHQVAHSDENSDNLTSLETMREFAQKIGAPLTIMDSGEHWFHTAEQMAFLDKWIRE